MRGGLKWDDFFYFFNILLILSAENAVCLSLVLIARHVCSDKTPLSLLDDISFC